MEWLKAILEKAEIKDGKLDVEALMSTINVEAPKNVMPKAEYNNISKQLKEANDTIKKLEKTHKKEIADMKKDAAINQALVKAKAKYPEVVAKLLDKDKVVINEDGTIIGLDEQLKATKENYKDMFEANDDSGIYKYNPQGGSGTQSTGATSFIDIINENQVKR